MTVAVDRVRTVTSGKFKSVVGCVKGTHAPYLFLLDYIKTWLQCHRCASDTWIRTANQKSIVKQEDPV